MNQIGTATEAEPLAQSPQDTPNASDKPDSAAAVAAEEQDLAPDEKPPHDPQPMEEDPVNPATVFSIKLKQPRSNLLHKMSVPELCRNFSAVSWCGKLNAIACAAETCARIPSSTANPPFWIPIHIVIPERPTECAVFNVIADSPRDSVQFIEWSPISCPRALLIANFHGRVTIWTQPSQGPANLVRDTSCWQREHEWRQDIAVVTKWLSGVSPYRWLSSKSSASANTKSTFEEKFLSQQSQTSARWPNFLCVCSVFSSGSVQLHWSQWPPSQSGTTPKWFCTSKGLLGCGPSGIMAGDAIITDSGAMHVAGVPIVNPSTIVVWEVTPGPGNGFQVAPKTISNFSAYVSPEAAAQSAATTTWGSGVTAVAFDPTRAGSVIAVVIVEGQYMSPYDPDEGPSITGWRVQRWESSLQHVVLHPIFRNPTSSMGGQPPMQTVWQSKVDLSIPPTNDFKNHQSPAIGMAADMQKASESVSDKSKRVNFDPFDLPSDVRTLARVVYSAHGGEIAIAFLRGGVHVFSGPNFTPVDNYQINVGSAIAAPAFSSTSCCSASVWHDSSKNCTILRIIRVLPPSIPISQVKANSSTWERAIAERFWWSLLVGVDWWDAVGCTQSAAEDGIVSLNSVIAVLDADFHSLPSVQHRQQYGPSLDRIKCRLLEGSNAQEVRAMVLDMQARLLLDMLGKGIESALINSSALVPELWQASAETLSSIDPESMAVEPALIPSIQVCFGYSFSLACLFHELFFDIFIHLIIFISTISCFLIVLIVKVLFMMLIDLCRRTAGLQHPLPVSQVGSSNIQVRLHYIDGNYTVLPEVVEASLGPHMNMPRPRGADAAGLLLRELELHPPAEEWHRRNMFGGPWSDPEDVDFANDAPKLVNSDPLDFSPLEHCDVYYGTQRLWPKKRRMSERDAAFGLNTSVGLGGYLGIMGSRRDVVTATWKTGLEGVWYKCVRCQRQTSAFASPDAAASPDQNEREIWWISRWAYGCPMCGGTWARVV
uniref:Mediator of RNA polymerase II transcription subunit 16 n=1 Tax=Cajanus cajan TaxID=3821 RepID=A0A151T1V5_CAJCA|nr:hypothetical protein KK1_023450 [Cajanus cajan]